VAEQDDSNLLSSIRELKDQEPFAPFTIVMTSGDRYRIDAPDNFVEMKAEYFYALPGGEKFVLIRKRQIASVERAANGRQKSRKKAS